MLLRDLHHLVHPLRVARVVGQVVGRHPGVDDDLGNGRADQLAAQTQHVGVRVRACQPCAERVLGHGRIHAGDLVGDQGAAVAHAINEDAALHLPVTYCQRRRVDEVRQVAAFLRERPEVHHLVALALQPFLQRRLHRKSGVIARHGYLHVRAPCG